MIFKSFIFFIPLMVFLVSCEAYKIENVNELKKNGVWTEAKVIKTGHEKPCRRCNSYQTFLVEYFADNVRYEKEFGGSDSNRLVSVGYNVKIIYLSSDPKQAYTEVHWDNFKDK